MTAESAVMVNLLGVDDSNDFVSHYRHAMQLHPHAKFHTYGKSARKGRKMGHVTVVASELGWALSEARAAAAVLLNG
jgi:5-(carboxyamino)imidazole ribonucleotide synthase